MRQRTALKDGQHLVEQLTFILIGVVTPSALDSQAQAGPPLEYGLDTSAPCVPLLFVLHLWPYIGTLILLRLHVSLRACGVKSGCSVRPRPSLLTHESM